MIGKFVGLPSADGDAFDGYLSMPASGRGPGVVMIPEIFGVNEGLRRCADLFAGQGYAVLAPDIFWRLGSDSSVGTKLVPSVSPGRSAPAISASVANTS